MLSRVRRLFSSSGDNYPYVVSRVRALKTHLLPETEYPKLIQRDVHEIARALEEGQYKEEVNELASGQSGAALIERATRLNLGRQFGKILSWCQGEPKELIALYFQRYDVHNVKTLLRGAQAGADREKTQAALIPAGTVPQQTYLAGLGAQSVEEVIHALEATPYGRVVAAMEGASLAEMENALDVAYYENLLGAVDPSDRPRQAFYEFLQREVDIVNLKLLLRVKNAGVQDYDLVPGGRHVNRELASRIMAADWPEALTILNETPFGEVLSEAFDAFLEAHDLTHLANALEHYHVDEAANFGHRYPLSILPIVDYVLRKRQEVDRIRIIAVGKQHNLPKEEIQALVNA